MRLTRPFRYFRGSTRRDQHKHWTKRAALAVTAVLAGFVPPLTPASAQDLFSALVKVNDTAITGFDVEQRARLIRLAQPRGDAEAIQRGALEQLIVDELKFQEAARQGVAVSDAQVDEAVQNLARRNNQSLDTFLGGLEQAGVERSVFERQLRADLLWNLRLRRRFGDRVTPTDAEVDAAVTGQVSEQPKRYDVRQIVVPLVPSAPDDLVVRAFEEAKRVRRELNNCDRIAELAPRYAKISGPVGRLTEEQMPGPIREAVTALEVGQAANPMRSPDGVHVIMLCGILTAESASRSQIYNRLLQEKAGRFSESYLDDLRRGAMIERRQ